MPRIRSASEKRRLLSTLVASALILLAALFGSTLARGQEYQPSVLKPGASVDSRLMSDFERIDPYSGNLTFSLPLATAKGRGDASLPLRLNANLKWERKEQWLTEDWTGYYDWVLPTDETREPWMDPVDPSSYTYGVDYLPYKATGTHYGWNTRTCGPYTESLETISTLTVLSPDGTRYELRDRSTGGAFKNTDCTANPGFNRGRMFDSIDGSGAIFISDQDVIDDPNTPYATTTWAVVGTLITRDGVRIRFGDTQPSITDRNGNKSTIDYQVIDSHYAIVETDPNGRKTTVEYHRQESSPYGFSDRISYSGAGGTTRYMHVSYKSLHDVIRSGLSVQTLRQLFPQNFDDNDYSAVGFNPDQTFDPVMPSTVWLPNGQSYQLFYNAYGEVARVVLPTGGAIEYDWGSNMGNGELDVWKDPNIYAPMIYRRLVERRVYSNGSTLDSKTTYSGLQSLGGHAGTVTEDLYDQGGTHLVNRTIHYYYGILGANESFHTDTTYKNLLNVESWRNGKEYQTDTLGSDGTTLLRRSTQTWDQSAPVWSTDDPSFATLNNPVVTASTMTLADSNQVSGHTFVHDSFGNLTDTYDYDYGSGVVGAFIRRTHTDYLATNAINSTNYQSDSVHITGLPTQSWISSDANGSTKVSLKTLEYDNYASDSRHASLTDRTGIVGHDSAYGTAFSPRGNATTETQYTSASNSTGAISTAAQYDIAGNVVKSYDANGNATTFSYSDCFGSPDTDATTNSAPSQLGGSNTFAFITSKTNPVSWTAYIQYDYFTGQPVNFEDANGVIAKTLYDDSLDRPTQTVTAVGTSLETQSSITYDDTGRTITTTTDLNTDGDNLLKSVTVYDGLGRTTESRTYETSTVYRAVDTQYDALGRPYKNSNPFRNGDTLVWTETVFDALGRVVSVTTPDSAVITTTYSGNATTVTDQAGKVRRMLTNSMDQLTRVDEPNGSNALGTTSAPNQPTYYTYNTLGKIVAVQQGSQNRYFQYDSLGRVLRAYQPEQEINSSLNTSGDPLNNSWTTGMTYDSNGNVLTTMDAKGTVITSTYDALNRPLTRSYSPNTTPTVTNTYDDSSISNSKGMLTKVSSSISETRYTGFDILGRLTETKQLTGGNTYTTGYAYNLEGSLTQVTYPGGRTVNTAYGSSGDIASITGTPYGGPSHTYASSFSYAPEGRISQLQLGNGLWETAHFNNRLQVTELDLGTTAGAYNTWKATCDYGEWNGSTVDPTKNSGNIGRQTVTFSGLANPFVQTYTYDSLDRITEAKETVNGTQTWIQDWGYDRYGNRSSFTQNILGNTTVSNPSISTTSNRYNASQGYTFDKNGNVTADVDPITGHVRSFTLDGDNKQTQVTDATTSTTAGTYSYDGEGHRVKKVTATETTIFVYANGQLLEERNSSNALTTSYLYAGKQLLATETSTDTNYIVTDNLGSPRVITNSSGAIVGRRDFLPFGEELFADGTYRKISDGYTTSGVDVVRQRFTGYQGDVESGLDFGEARYYDNAHARFTAVDPSGESFVASNPQSFNRYLYALNRPLVMTDPTGQVPGDYYDEDDGSYLGSDGKKDHKVYTAKEVTGTRVVDASGVITRQVTDVNLVNGVTDDEFRVMSNIIEQEAGGSNVNEDIWLAHTAANHAQATNTSTYSLLQTGYSSAPDKTSQLSDQDGSTDANNARFGVIHALTGRADPTGGAEYWDGVDFLLLGLSHAKFTQYDSVAIKQDVLNTFVASQGASSFRFHGTRYPVPNAAFRSHTGAWSTPSGAVETGFLYRRNTGTGILYATGTQGKSIFWTTQYHW